MNLFELNVPRVAAIGLISALAMSQSPTPSDSMSSQPEEPVHYLEYLAVSSDSNNTGIDDALEQAPNATLTFKPSSQRVRWRPHAVAYPSPLPRDSTLRVVVSNRADGAAVCVHLQLPDGSLVAASLLTRDRAGSGTVAFPPVGDIPADSLLIHVYTRSGNLVAIVPLR